MKFSSKWIYLTVSIASLSFSSLHAEEEKHGFLHEYIKKSLEAWEIPGAAVAVIKDDKLVFSGAYGIRKTGGTSPVNSNTLFFIGPCGKSFTTTSMLMLADRDLLLLDKPLYQQLPSFQTNDPWISRHFTPRDTLLQRGGFDSDQGKMLWHWGYSKHEILLRLNKMKMYRPFRSYYADSHLNDLIQTETVSHLSKRSWDYLIKQYILEPLQLKNTYLGVRAVSQTENIALPHVNLEGKLMTKSALEFESIAPTNIVISSVRDMSEWARCWINYGELDGVRLITQDSVCKAFSPQIEVPLHDPVRNDLFPELTNKNFLAHGFGWFIHDYQGYKTIEQAGSLPGTSARITMIPDKKLGIVILANRDVDHFLSAVKLKLVDYFTESESSQDWNTILFEKHKQEVIEDQESWQIVLDQRRANTSLKYALEKYEGSFTNEIYGEFKIFQKDKELWIEAGPGKSTAKLEHWHYDTFKIDWKSPFFERPDFISFSFDTLNTITKVYLESSGSFRPIPNM